MAVPKSYHLDSKGSWGNSWSIVTQLYKGLNEKKTDLNPTKTFLQDAQRDSWWAGKLDSEAGYQHSQ